MRFLNENLLYFFIYLSIVMYYLFHSGYERRWVFLLVAVAGTMNQILYSHWLRSCVNEHVNPANTRYWTNVGLMLGQRRRRWANINPTLGQRLVFARNLAANGCTASFLRLGQRCRRWPNDVENVETTMYSIQQIRAPWDCPFCGYADPDPSWASMRGRGMGVSSQSGHDTSHKRLGTIQLAMSSQGQIPRYSLKRHLKNSVIQQKNRCGETHHTKRDITIATIISASCYEIHWHVVKYNKCGGRKGAAVRHNVPS